MEAGYPPRRRTYPVAPPALVGRGFRRRCTFSGSVTPQPVHHPVDVACAPVTKVLEAWQLSEQIIGCLLALGVDAMSGMVTQVRRPRRDEVQASVLLCDPGSLRPNRHSGDANA